MAHRFRLTIGCLLLMLAALLVLHIASGRTMMPLDEAASALFNRSDDSGHRHIVWNLRLPRVLVAITAGAMLGLSGAILQVVLRNPLVEPGLVGASSGAVLFIVLWTLLAQGTAPMLAAIPFVAMLGGVVTMSAILALNGMKSSRIARLALTGVIASSVIQSMTSLLLLKHQMGLTSIMLWTFGSLNGRVWQHLHMIWPWMAALSVLAMLLARRASLLQLGAETAAGLGLTVNRTSMALLLIAVALAAASVSAVGAIGFIGLIGPHVAAMLVGRNPLYHFPTSALFSATLLTAADWAGQRIAVQLPLPGMEYHVTSLPTGAVTTLMGAPFFLYLLRRTLTKK